MDGFPKCLNHVSKLLSKKGPRSERQADSWPSSGTTFGERLSCSPEAQAEVRALDLKLGC